MSCLAVVSDAASGLGRSIGGKIFLPGCSPDELGLQSQVVKRSLVDEADTS